MKPPCLASSAFSAASAPESGEWPTTNLATIPDSVSSLLLSDSLEGAHVARSASRLFS